MKFTAYCITLRTTPEREKRAREYFSGPGGFPINMFYGIDSTALGIHIADGMLRDFRVIDDWVSQGHVGCILSHYMLWQTILEERAIGDDENIFIFEDDVVLENDFVMSVKTSMETEVVPPDWQLLYFGHESIDGCGFERINDKIVAGIF